MNTLFNPADFGIDDQTAWLVVGKDQRSKTHLFDSFQSTTSVCGRYQRRTEDSEAERGRKGKRAIVTKLRNGLLDDVTCMHCNPQAVDCDGATPDEPGSGPQHETCGSCSHLVSVNQRFSKCGLMRSKWTNGSGTDIKKNWPACSKWTTLLTWAAIFRAAKMRDLTWDDEWFWLNPLADMLLEEGHPLGNFVVELCQIRDQEGLKKLANGLVLGEQGLHYLEPDPVYTGCIPGTPIAERHIRVNF